MKSLWRFLVIEKKKFRNGNDSDCAPCEKRNYRAVQWWNARTRARFTILGIWETDNRKRVPRTPARLCFLPFDRLEQWQAKCTFHRSPSPMFREWLIGPTFNFNFQSSFNRTIFVFLFSLSELIHIVWIKNILLCNNFLNIDQRWCVIHKNQLQQYSFTIHFFLYKPLHQDSFVLSRNYRI